MLLFVILLNGLVMVLVLVGARQRLRLDRLRRAGIYPEKGKATDADVTRLKHAGELALAVRCYREIHGVSLPEAHAAVTGTPTSNPEMPPFHFPPGD
jgi:hypothetical protein